MSDLDLVLSSVSDDDDKDLSTVTARRRLPYDGMDHKTVHPQETALETGSSTASTVTASVQSCGLPPAEPGLQECFSYTPGGRWCHHIVDREGEGERRTKMHNCTREWGLGGINLQLVRLSKKKFSVTFAISSCLEGHPNSGSKFQRSIEHKNKIINKY